MKFRLPMLILCRVLLVATLSAGTLYGQIIVTPPATQTDQFFNSQFLNNSMDSNHDPDWPQQRYYGLRIWDSWKNIETAPGVYNWSLLSKYMAHANDTYTQHGSDLLFSFYGVPSWAHKKDNANNAGLEPYDLNGNFDDSEFVTFVTALMGQLCPTPSTCAVRNFEMWNEFNTNSWISPLADLAKMSSDAATVIRSKCSNCKIIAGSTSGGGSGANPDSGDYLGALQIYLADWKALGTPEPDAISWHPYPARLSGPSGHALSPVSFPENVYSGNGYGTSPAGYGTGEAGDDGTSDCTLANSGMTNGVKNSNYTTCSASIHQQVLNLRNTLTADSTYGVAGAPIWATEGGWGENGNLQNSDNNDQNLVNAPCSHTPCWQDQLRAGYLARWMILLRADGVQRAYWYAWDEPCWGTNYSADQYGTRYDGTTGSLGYHTCNDQHNYYPSNACQTVSGYYEGQTSQGQQTNFGPTFCETWSTGTKSIPGIAWDNVTLWLQNITSHPVCSTTAVTAGTIWTCTIARSTPTGYHGLIAWFVPAPAPGAAWIATYSGYYPPASGHYSQWRELLGTLHQNYSNNYAITLGWEPVLFESVD